MCVVDAGVCLSIGAGAVVDAGAVVAAGAAGANRPSSPTPLFSPCCLVLSGLFVS